IELHYFPTRRSSDLGILANGAKAFHLSSLVHNLTDNVTVLTTGKADFDSGQIEKLNKNNIKFIETQISEFENQNGHIQNVVFIDGTELSFDAVYAAIPFLQSSDIPISLGCELTEHGYLKVDNLQK